MTKEPRHGNQSWSWADPFACSSFRHWKEGKEAYAYQGRLRPVAKKHRDPGASGEEWEQRSCVAVGAGIGGSWIRRNCKRPLPYFCELPVADGTNRGCEACPRGTYKRVSARFGAGAFLHLYLSFF